MELHGLPGGQPHRAVAVIAGDAVERKPLLRRQHATGDADPQHKGEGLLQLFAAAFGAEVAVVLQVHAVKFDKLLVIIGDRAGDVLAQSFSQRTTKVVAGFLDAFVGGKLVSHVQ